MEKHGHGKWVDGAISKGKVLPNCIQISLHFLIDQKIVFFKYTAFTVEGPGLVIHALLETHLDDEWMEVYVEGYRCTRTLMQLKKTRPE
jgi:hypothetical protein